MANISKIKIENTTYDLKDETARDYSNYSTTEQLIGTWINGENLYRKVIHETTTTPVGTAGQVHDYNFPHGISNFNKMVSITGNINGQYTFTQFGGNNVDYGTYINKVDSTNIQVRISNDSWTGTNDWYFIIKYTKSS